MFKVYSIYDSKANAFNQPFFCLNNEVAKRTVAKAVLDGEYDIKLFKEDYSLFEFGTWDPQLGKFDMRDAGENLGLIAAIVGRFMER